MQEPGKPQLIVLINACRLSRHLAGCWLHATCRRCTSLAPPLLSHCAAARALRLENDALISIQMRRLEQPSPAAALEPAEELSAQPALVLRNLPCSASCAPT